MKELWYVSCSPRDPAKIRKELSLLAKLEGMEWNARDRSGDHITQLKFAGLLREHSEFEGEASGKESDFSARDRFAPMKTYGFAYVNGQGCVRITKAGKALINGEDEGYVFMMQMLKWQYPSAQHRGREYVNEPADLFGQKRLGFSILPFIFTLKVAKQVGGLTKREIAIFLLPHRRMRGVSTVALNIRNYRAGRDRKRGRVRKRQYDETQHKRVFRRCYGELLSQNRGKRAREIVLKKKVRNSLDVADACMRLFRYTGIFATEGHRLVLNPTRAEETELILGRKWKPASFYDDVERFYEYFGDHEKPQLPFFSAPFLVDKILGLQRGLQKIRVPSMRKREKPLWTRASLTQRTPAELRRIQAQILDLYRRTKENAIANYLRSRRGQSEVLEFYDAIVERDVADPATFLEWNTWRALIALDDCERITPNFKMDDNLQPVNCAPGNCPDMVAEFGEYVVAVEVTLTTGRRQHSHEPEPVTYHVGKCQHEEHTDGQGRKVFGLFIAPAINLYAAEYFKKHIRDLSVGEYGHVTVVPIGLQKWLDILKFANSLGYLRKHALGDLLGEIEAAGKRRTRVEEWLESIEIVIENWKKRIMRGATEQGAA